MNAFERDELLARLRAALGDGPPSIVAEFYCELVDQHRGDRTLKISFRDGRYQRTRLELSLAEHRRDVEAAGAQQDR